MQPLVHAIPWVALLLLAVWVTGQVRKPSGPLGRLIVERMNESHASLTDWGLEHVEVARTATARCR